MRTTVNREPISLNKATVSRVSAVRGVRLRARKQCLSLAQCTFESSYKWYGITSFSVLDLPVRTADMRFFDVESHS